MQFPCFMYHAAHGARLFADADDFQGAGVGWVDTPAKLTADTPADAGTETPIEPAKRKPGRPKKAD